jgi:hypothetical protein
MRRDKKGELKSFPVFLSPLCSLLKSNQKLTCYPILPAVAVRRICGLEAQKKTHQGPHLGRIEEAKRSSRVNAAAGDILGCLVPHF